MLTCTAAAASLLWVLLVAGTHSVEAKATDMPPDVPDFWPDVEGDLRKVTWAHAVNDRRKLLEALKGDVMMLEADVSVSSDGETPIMAHPPANTSDLTLQQFLEDLAANGKKGAKLDFKSTDAWEKSAPLLRALAARVQNIPVWLNADIVAGPGGGSPGVNASRFLADCVENFPGRTLSVGWTTGAEGAAYTKKHVDSMVNALSEANVTDAQPVTFPVRAASAQKASDALLALLQQKPKATLTLWGSEADKVDNADLLLLAQAVGFERLYVDLPNRVPGLNSGGGRARGGGAVALMLAGIFALSSFILNFH